MADTAVETQLSIPEGVLLGHALVARVAESLGIRAFFIKGPASVIQGLRPPKISNDVDVLVAPSNLEQMLQGLRERGWRERPLDPGSWTFPTHSVTLDHPEWPCCVDVHFRFPGMESSVADCFEVMWTNSVDLTLAGQEVRVPSRALGILILALHALRSSQLPACQQELEFLSDLTRQQSHASALLEMATATGSLAAMRPFLKDLLPENLELVWPQSSTEWRSRVMAKKPGRALLMALVRAPWQDKPSLLLRGVFPRREELVSWNIQADMSLSEQLLLHRARWVRFLRSAPQIVLDLRSISG